VDIFRWCCCSGVRCRAYRRGAGGCGVAVRFLLFFFQAEDGIRDRNVTGVQTCALPICSALPLCAAICSVLSLLISYWGSSAEALRVWPLYSKSEVCTLITFPETRPASEFHDTWSPTA